MAKKAFKSESKRLLDLMINSIYTNKDIFLRELISNSSDALDKLYYRSLTDKKIKVKKDKLEINISFDKDNRTLTVSDNGCGMTKEELESNLGTIAKSGSLNFKENMTKDEKIDIIGQFGVGFYSAFMVSDKITVTSKSVDDDKAYVWESEGVDGYTITEGKKKDIGTEIVLKIKEDDDEFNYSKYLEEYQLKQLVKKYSDYISFPIKMECTHHELVDEEKKEYKDTKEIETLNSMVPIWKKNKKDVKDEDYDNFYMDKFSDYDKPLKVISSSVEGMISYKSLLFIPSHAPYDFYTQEYEKGLALYSNGVMIMEKCGDLLPDYFSFVKGVVDSEDLSLNISREILQESQAVKLIAKNIESKIRKELEVMMKDDRDEYISFFKTFGVQLKYGVYNNYGADKDKLKDLVMFYSAKHEKLISISEYVSEMKDGQDTIYYASGSSVDKINSLLAEPLDLLPTEGFLSDKQLGHLLDRKHSFVLCYILRVNTLCGFQGGSVLAEQILDLLLPFPFLNALVQVGVRLLDGLVSFSFLFLSLVVDRPENLRLFCRKIHDLGQIGDFLRHPLFFVVPLSFRLVTEGAKREQHQSGYEICNFTFHNNLHLL